MASQLSGCSSQRLVLTIMPRRVDETHLKRDNPHYSDIFVKRNMLRPISYRNKKSKSSRWRDRRNLFKTGHA